MILRAVYDGGSDPFEGERELVLRGLPADARVIAARATVTPVDASGGRDPFAEEIHFSGPNGASGDWGATQVRAAGFAEIDFHARRTLAGLTGSDLAGGAQLQVDLGGSFVGVDTNGAIAMNGASLLPLANDGPLPGIAASRIRISFATRAPAITMVRIRSLPANVTLALAGRPALFFQAGELAVERTAADFGALLAGYLDDGAETADGVFMLPFVLHSDSIARLRITVEIEYLRTSSLLPAGLPEAKLAYDLATVPRAGSAALAVDLPAAAVPVAAASLGKVIGPFAETRIAWGPLGDSSEAGAAESTVALSPARSAAQPFALPDRTAGYEITAVDLRLAAVDRRVKLTLDLRRDDSGKPGTESLLAAAVPFELTRAADGGAAWLSVELPRPVTLQSAADRKAWLLLQSAEGEAAWSVRPADPEAVPLQASEDGGFSYRAAAGRLSAQLRLRERPAGYRLPLTAQLGTGAEAVLVDLSRLSPLGKVAFDLSIPEISAGISAALARAQAAGGPFRGELLADPAFARWEAAGDTIGAPRNLSASGTSLELPHLAAFAPDGRTAFSVLTGRESAKGAPQLIAWDTELFAEAWRLDLGLGANVGSAFPRGLAVDPAGRFVYLLLQGGIAAIDLATHRLLGRPIPVEETLFAPSVLALSDDGAQLAVAASAAGNVLSPALATYDAEQLIDLIRRGASLATEARLQSVVPGGDPVDVTFSSDGSRLYLLTEQHDSGAKDGGTLFAYDARSLATPPLLQVPFDGTPRALARVPDLSGTERSLLVLHPNRLDRYDAATLAPLAPMPSLALSEKGFSALAVEPGGHRALVVGAGDLLAAVALSPTDMRLATETRSAGPGTALAIAPLGDRAFLVTPPSLSGARLTTAAQVLPLGAPQPLVWTVTAGRVSPLTLSGAAGRGVELGEATSAAFSTRLPTQQPLGPSALSQVVPAEPGHSYELSFFGRASGSARAEVLWRSASGETLATETLPIEAGAPGATGALPLRRARFTAPALTSAAEIRFVAEDGLTLLRDASFRAPANALVHGDLLGNREESWAQQPPAAPGFRIAPPPAGTAGAQVRNAGAALVTLRQEIAATPGAPFELRLRARLDSGPPPRLDLRFLAADGTPMGTPLTIEIPLRGFDTALALGAVPASAARAEALLSIPAGTALRLEAIELRIEPRVRLPLTFLAEAPGELAVIGGAIAWDLADPHAAASANPAIPRPDAPSLPAPTPPPGAVEADDCGCDDGATAAPVVAPSPAPVLQPAPVDPIAVVGIGPRRAEILRARGITTLDALVAADPRELARVLPTVSEKMAVDFIRQARELRGLAPS